MWLSPPFIRVFWKLLMLSKVIFTNLGIDVYGILCALKARAIGQVIRKSIKR